MIEVTDFDGKGERTILGSHSEVSTMVRIGDGLFFVYQANTRTDRTYRIFVRRYDLRERRFGPSVVVDPVAPGEKNAYHGAPTILRDRLGRVNVLNAGDAEARDPCNAPEKVDLIRPRRLIIGNLYDRATWIGPTCLDSRVPSNMADRRAALYDIMGVYDDRTGITHFVGELAWASNVDNRPISGLPRGYSRFLPDGRADGPYVIVEAVCKRPDEFPRRDTSCGNIFCKGDLVLGKEPAGPRSLHLFWNIRHTFEEPKGTLHQWNYNLYYARSDDGGETWRSADGRATVRLRDHIRWNDARFLAYEGDVAQNSERGFDVDSLGRPFVVFSRHRPGTGVRFGPHVDVAQSERVPARYDLAWRRWDGHAWVERTISNRMNWEFALARTRLDKDDAVHVFVGDPPRIITSRDGGMTWSRPIELGRTGGSGWRLYSYADPVDPDWHYIAFQHRENLRLFFVPIRLTGP